MPSWFEENGLVGIEADPSAGLRNMGDVAPAAAPAAGPASPQWGLGGGPVSAPAPSGGAPRSQAPAAPAQGGGGGQDQSWLDWIARTYGHSASRGGGFADLPQGQSLQSVIQRFNQETGANAQYIGGPSGDKVDFGQGVTDALTGEGQLWSDYGAVGGQARAGASRGGGGGGGGGGYGGDGIQGNSSSSYAAGSSTGSGQTGTQVALPTAPTYQNFEGGPAFQAPSQTPGPFTPTSTYGESSPFAGTGDVPTPTQTSYTNYERPPGFVAPTAAEAAMDPGYQFRQQQAAAALENSASARGMSRTNNTWQGLQAQAGDLASQEYAQVYGRRLGEAQQDYNQGFQTNQANNQGNFATTQANNASALAAQQAQYGQAANTYGVNQAGQAQQYGQQANTYGQNLASQNQQFNQAMGGYQQNYANNFNTNQANNAGALGNYNSQVNAALGQGNLALGYTSAANQLSLGQGQLGLGYQQAANQYSLGQQGNALGYSQLGQNAYQFNTNQGNWLNNNAWQQNMDVAQLGNPGAPNSQQGGLDQGSIYGQIGNSNAAGLVGGANAWGNFASQLGNQVGGAYQDYQQGQRPQTTLGAPPPAWAPDDDYLRRR